MENEDINLSLLLKELWNSIESKRRIQLFFLIGLMLISAFVEVLSLGAVMPFLAVLISPEEAFNQPLISLVAHYLNLIEPSELIFPLTAAFISASIIAGILRIFVLWLTTKLSVLNGSDLSTKVYKNTLYQPYEVHVARNTSEVISGISAKINDVVFRIIQSFLVLISSFLVIISIILALIFIDPVIALTSFLIFGGSYFFISRIFVRKLSNNSKRIADEQTQVVKALQEGLGGIRDVLLNGTQEFYTSIYKKADFPLRHALGNNNFLGQSPRFAIEALAIVLISLLAFFLTSSSEGIGEYVPLLGALALGAQRLLPNLQLSYASWASIIGSKSSLKDIIELLQNSKKERDIPLDIKTVDFKKSLKIENVSFKYENQENFALDNINLVIQRNSKIGFVGSTGSGKSTLFDLIMGLLKPINGKVLLDDNPLLEEDIAGWQRNISHVPQNIYLSDGTIAENIAFGIEPSLVDIGRVKFAADVACISSFIESNPSKYDALVGERGVKISGGEKQRIGIARAIYKERKLLILDEATSALDNSTEKKVIEAITNLKSKPTILMIAHRLSTVKSCDSIVQLENGKIVAKGSYEDLLKNSSSFKELASEMEKN
tara:strand:- start:3021 stop:4838 length:1818 start_codon:yes stop_codon:yes gene_type:complete